MDGNLFLVLVPQGLELLLALVLGDFFTPFFLKIAHDDTTFVLFINKNRLYHNIALIIKKTTQKQRYLEKKCKYFPKFTKKSPLELQSGEILRFLFKVERTK